MSSILNILNQVSFGRHYLQIALLLRESLLINSMLNNVEVWHGITRDEEKEFQKVDLILLRKLLGAPISTPKESFFLELGILPISILLKAKRVRYLHYPLNKNKAEMLSRFFWAQWRRPCKGDWVNLIKQDLAELGIPDDLEKITAYSKLSFKKYVKDRSKEVAFQSLMSCKENHSKMSWINYSELGMQDIYSSSELSIDEARVIFLFRVHMCQFTQNFRGTNVYDLCLLCRNHPDTQESMSECKELKRQFAYMNIGKMIKDVYSGKVGTETVRDLKLILSFREEKKKMMEV